MPGKYSDVSLSRNREIQFDNDGRIFEKASLLASQRTDSLGSEIEHQHNPISYSYDYAVNDGPAGPVISKTEQSDGVLTRVRTRLWSGNWGISCLQGEYSVRLPNGLVQTVSYSVQGEGGFSVNVKYSGQDWVLIWRDRSWYYIWDLTGERQPPPLGRGRDINSLNSVDYIPHKWFGNNYVFRK